MVFSQVAISQAATSQVFHNGSTNPPYPVLAAGIGPLAHSSLRA